VATAIARECARAMDAGGSAGSSGGGVVSGMAASQHQGRPGEV
jgi:hypothetical protein